MISENSTPASSVIDDVFGENLKKYRERKGLTQEALNNEMVKRGFEFHPTTIYRIEKGRRRVLIGEAVTLAEVLDVPLDQLTSPGEDSERAILFQVKQIAREHLEDISRAIAYLETAKANPSIIETFISKLEDPEKVHDFAGVKTTAKEFYKPITESSVNPALESLDDIAKKSRALVEFLMA